MEMATGTLLPGQAPKAVPNDAWGQFLQRVLVSVRHGGEAPGEARVAAGHTLSPRPVAAGDGGESASGR